MSSGGNNSREQVEDSTLSPSEALTECLLSQYRFCAGGVGLGAAYGIKYAKGALPMVAGGIAGTVADLVYGSTVACVKEVEIYRKHGTVAGGGHGERASSVIQIRRNDDEK